jgi:uncharacterized protein
VSEVFANAQPVQGLIGGLLIGLAAALMLLGAGRIAGVSGITARATCLSPSGMSMSSAWAFLIGLPAGALAVAWLLSLPPAQFASWPVLAIAGVLVGFGTRLGSGCTSGHGVCGVSRLSRRSVVATAAFMMAGIVTVAVTNIMMGGVS